MLPPRAGLDDAALPSGCRGIPLGALIMENLVQKLGAAGRAVSDAHSAHRLKVVKLFKRKKLDRNRVCSTRQRQNARATLMGLD